MMDLQHGSVFMKNAKIEASTGITSFVNSLNQSLTLH